MASPTFSSFVYSACIISLSIVPAASETPLYESVILDQKVISKEPGRYCGWPSIATLASGRLMVVYSGDRDWHVCPWGKTHMVYSDDSGQTWSEPKTITNTPLDDRGAGILVTDKGTILVTWFTSLAFANEQSPFYERRYSSYAGHTAQLTAQTKEKWLGAWVIRSEDGGDTWGEPIRIPFETPHGPIQLRDGRILMVSGSGVAESEDDGLAWKMLSRFRSGYGRLSEVYPIERSDGEILVLSRANQLRQFGSSDGGRTWSEPFETELAGYPPHMIELDNGWLVAVYGRRKGLPMGQFASISMDGGKTWDVKNEITLAIADKHSGTEEELGYPPNWDLGYPASTLLEDGSIWTVYYQVDQDGEWPSIIGTHWKLKIKTSEKARINFRHLEPNSLEAGTGGVQTHLDVNFSDYSLGNVIDQTGGSKGAWSGGASWNGEVIPVAGYRSGTQALQVSSLTGGAAGRGILPICPGAPEVPNSSLLLESADKMYWSVDLFAKSRDSGVALIMSDTSSGKTAQTGFQLFLNTTDKPVSFATSVQEEDGLTRSVMVDSSLTPEEETWYRFEFEINQSDIPGKGTFSVFASTQQDATRRAILTDQPYAFLASQLPNLFVVPLAGNGSSDGVQINHIILQSGLSTFPENTGF